ncbi:TMV resistance protein N-like protein [Tanacetum coccineum]
MSSTSSTTVAPSPPHAATKFDVFLSFRGEDTRNNITGHIYEALKRASLATFRDNIEIRKGLELEPEIISAIKASETSVIVISENFATSTFCLEELSLILDQRRDCNHYVLPAFFKVDPSDVRKQTGSFKIEVKDDSTKWTRDNVNRWKTALTMASNLIGVVLEKSETEFVNDIVDTIFDKVTSKKFHLPLNLVRIEARYKDIDFWIKQSDAKLLVIWGMGGSGKTTLARYIIYSNHDKFENISIIEHISSKWKEPQHLLELQEKLLEGVLGGKKRKILSESRGTSMIEQALETTKSLIFLDDIANHEQLLRLIGTGKINEESKIIVTTRETKIAEWFGSRYGRCWEYKMRLLDPDESLELLSLHAFGSKNPLEEYKELAQEVLVYCKGNPLALEVLGSSLSQDINILSWKSALDKIKSNIHSGIHSVLKTSYDSLPHDCEKNLFLHIACFFNGADMDSVVKIFEHDCFAVSSLKTLTKRCLLSISSNQTLLMHPLLQEMGRFIVYEESPKDPAERSRVWQNSESYDLLSNGMVRHFLCVC